MTNKSVLFFLIFLPLAVLAQTGKSTRNLFDNKTVGEIRLTLPGAKWSDALDSMRIYGMGMMVGNAVVDGVRYEGAGVRFRGDKSYQVGLKRNPMSIRLNHTNTDANHQGYTSLKLSSALRDPSLVREMLFAEIASKYMPMPQMSYTKLYINEEYVGIFINVESIEKTFLENNYGSSGNTFIKAGVDYPAPSPAECKQGIYASLEYEDKVECYKNNFELNSATGWNDLQELARTLNNDPGKIDKILDVDRTLWMLALNNVMVNLNSYSGNHSLNYYLYKDDNGRFQPILWDLNLAFGSYKNTGRGSDLELKELQNLDPLLHADNLYKPLIHFLLKDPLNKKMYLSHVRQIVEEHFSNGAYEKRAQELQGMIVVAFSDDKNKTYSLDDFQRSLRETVGKKSKIPGLVELMSKRASYLKRHPELSALAPAISDISVQGRGKFENQKLNTFRISAKSDRFPRRMMLYYRMSNKAVYTPVIMSEEGNAEGSSSARVFSVNIEASNPDATLEYYIVSETAGTVGISPAGYTQKPHKVKLSDLNK
jgi:hypothetical protein